MPIPSALSPFVRRWPDDTGVLARPDRLTAP